MAISHATPGSDRVPMNLSDVVDGRLILLDLEGHSKEDVLREISRQVAAVGELDEKTVFRLFHEREDVGTTGMGGGVAVPHIRVRGLRAPVLGFARSRLGAEFAAKDGRPVRLFAILLAPDEDPASHLQLLARVARLFRRTEACQRLEEAGCQEDFLRVLAEEDAKA